jgi:hypothetical protein
MIEFFVKVAFVFMLPFAILSVGFDVGKSYVEFIMKAKH